MTQNLHWCPQKPFLKTICYSSIQTKKLVGMWDVFYYSVTNKISQVYNGYPISSSHQSPTMTTDRFSTTMLIVVSSTPQSIPWKLYSSWLTTVLHTNMCSDMEPSESIKMKTSYYQMNKRTHYCSYKVKLNYQMLLSGCSPLRKYGA